MNIKEIFDLCIYSLKKIVIDTIEIFSELKKPKTWLYIGFAVLYIAIIKDRMDIVKWMVPFIIIVYILRQKIEGTYRYEKFKEDITNDNDSYLLKEYYHSYTKDCMVKKISPWDYEEWKREEYKKLFR